MEKFKDVVLFGDYFKEFIESVPTKARRKILVFLDVLKYLDVIPANYLKHIEGPQDFTRQEWISVVMHSEFSAFLTKER